MLIGTLTIASTANRALGAFRQAWDPQGSVTGRLARAAGWSLAGAMFARALSLAATVGASRTLGSELFGRFGFVQNTVGVFALVLGSALALTATKRVADYATTDRAQASHQAYHSVLWGGLVGTVSALALFATSGLLATTALGDPSLAPALRLSAPLVAFSTVSTVVTGVLAGFERFRLLTMLTAVRGRAPVPTPDHRCTDRVAVRSPGRAHRCRSSRSGCELRLPPPSMHPAGERRVREARRRHPRRLADDRACNRRDHRHVC